MLFSACKKPDLEKEWVKRLRNPVERKAAVGYFVEQSKRAKTSEEKARISAVVVPALCKLYREYREPGVLRHIVSFGDRSAVPTLLSVLESPTSSRASIALVARTLVDLRATEAVGPLGRVVQKIPAPGKPGHAAGLEAASLLGKLGDRRAVPGLIKALSSSWAPLDIELCKAASTALGALGDVRAVPSLIGALLTKGAHRGDCYPQARVALALLGPAAVKAMVGLLEDPKALSQRAARHELTNDAATTRVVTLLGDVVAREAGPVLLKLASAREQGHSVREAAVAALGDAGGEEAVEPLLKILKDGKAHHRLRGQVCGALTRLGVKRAIPTLLDLADRGTLEGGHDDLRYAAAEAYGLLVGAEVETGYERIKEIWKKENKRLGKGVFRRVLDRQELATRCLDDAMCYAGVVADRNQTPVRRHKAVVMVSTLPGGREALPHIVRALHVRDARLRRLFLRSAARLGKSTDSALVKTLKAIIKRDASRKATFIGGDLGSDGRVALAVVLRKK